jgi:DNA polymerase-3 subunit epsilon
MKDFVAIDFETANPKRVSACALGFTVVKQGEIVESNGFLMKPVGGHAPFQTKIHGIQESDTADKPEFGDVYSSLAHLFALPLVGHSMFDKQVLNALSEHFSLQIRFDYTDSVSVAKAKLPNLKNHKLKTVAKHFELPSFKHHDATDDAKVCADFFVRLQRVDSVLAPPCNSNEFETLASTILDDGRVDYKEAYQLMYWLEDLGSEASEFEALLAVVKQALDDDVLDEIEGEAIKAMLNLAIHNRSK